MSDAVFAKWYVALGFLYFTCFSFTHFFLGRAFAATTTEGLLVYSLDAQMIFEPFDLSEDITPKTIRATLRSKDYNRAFTMALKLNELKLIREVYESIPLDSIPIVVQTLAPTFIERVLSFVVSQVETSPHIEFNLKWIVSMLYEHGSYFQKRTPSTVMILRSVQKAVGRKFEDLSKLCQHNRYMLQYLTALGGVAQKRNAREVLGSENDDSLSGEEMDTEMIAS